MQKLAIFPRQMKAIATTKFVLQIWEHHSDLIFALTPPPPPLLVLLGPANNFFDIFYIPPEK